MRFAIFTRERAPKPEKCRYCDGKLNKAGECPVCTDPETRTREGSRPLTNAVERQGRA